MSIGKVELPNPWYQWQASEELSEEDALSIADMMQSRGWKLTEEKIFKKQLVFIAQRLMAGATLEEYHHSRGSYWALWTVLTQLRQVAEGNRKPEPPTINDEYWEGYA